MELFTFAQAQLQLYPAALEVQGQGDEAVAVPLDVAEQLHNLPLVHEQLALAQGISVKDISLLIGGDMHTHHEHLAVLDGAIAILQIDRTGPEALDLGAGKGNAAFIGLLHEIVVPGLAVDGDDFAVGFLFVCQSPNTPFALDFILS